MARESPSWGYDRIVGAMANLGHKLSDETVGNILRRMTYRRLRSVSRPQTGRRLFELTWRSGGNELLHGGSAYPNRLEKRIMCCSSFT